MPLKRLASVPFYPVVLAGVIVFSAYLDADISLHAAVRPFLIVVLAAAAVTTIAVRVFGSGRGPVLAAVAILVMRSPDPRRLGLAALLVIVAGVGWMFARRILPQVSTSRDANRALNLFSLALVLVTFSLSAISGTWQRVDLQQGRPFSSVQKVTAGIAGLPDIYLILLDGYPRVDTLHRLFGFDNSPFLTALRDRGFDVADNSRSNYMYTAMTLTSVLHMAYVHEIPGAAGVATPYGASLRTLINNNPVWDRLRSLGYVIAANQSPWETVGMRQADLFCGDRINDFELYLLRTTLVGPIVTAINPAFEGDEHRDVVNQAFECLGNLSSLTRSPKLVLIHVGGPHLPVVFTRSGGAAGLDVLGHTAQELKVSSERFESAYTEEVEYLNSRVLESVDLLARRPDQPIVVIWSDHGSESHLDWADSSRSDLRERFSNFFAARAPSRQSVFPEDITPINIFPILFDTYFDESIPLRDPRFFLSPIQNKLEFTEIPDPDG